MEMNWISILPNCLKFDNFKLRKFLFLALWIIVNFHASCHKRQHWTDSHDALTRAGLRDLAAHLPFTMVIAIIKYTAKIDEQD